MGDPSGIGPEALVAALRRPAVRRACVPLVVGSREVLSRRGWTPGLAALADSGPCRARPGRPSPEGARASFSALRLALRLAARGLARGLVTGPISKEAWRSAGIPHRDHTEFLQEATGTDRVAMMLLSGGLRAVLATRHVPLGEVPRRLSVREVVEAAGLAREALRDGLGIARPRLGLCGLNPHAGEGGLLGPEERRILRPAAARLGRLGLSVAGPLPADDAWVRHRAGELDALVALYHDQALIPLKLASPYGVVNWTLGVPLIRTSPGHGTAFDIAGKGRARPDAFIAAALLAARLASRRLHGG